MFAHNPWQQVRILTFFIVVYISYSFLYRFRFSFFSFYFEGRPEIQILISVILRLVTQSRNHATIK